MSKKILCDRCRKEIVRNRHWVKTGNALTMAEAEYDFCSDCIKFVAKAIEQACEGVES